MSASKQEVQELANRLLEILGIRMLAGSIEIHFSEDGLVQKVDQHTIPWRRRTEPRPLVQEKLTSR